ncbi:phage baseplate assembly protein V [Humidesulfovibrio mexicanus]|uniref:Phage baseplate assembly protein V n=1 Tax=Humidesulfovibrio mexicanus TaxID=147047 RepID=A0A239AI57_9BACT|nr:phage baseplate assembly protein V [Humidesulfovibrio mexicanus]SNR95220.1 phage baseplate assembly protein V [Humidesulfovibrio mexicanus]
MIRDVMRYVDRRFAGLRLAFRARLSTLGKGAAVQLAQAEALAGERLQAAELFQHFGFTSAPPPGTQLIVLPLGGSTAHSVIIATENGAYRVDVASGEACIYSMWGDKVHLKQERIEVETKTLHIKASQQVVFETPSITMQGTGGGAAAATMTGSLHTTGAITSDGDHVAGGVSLEHHTHPGDSGGTTGEPK